MDEGQDTLYALPSSTDGGVRLYTLMRIGQSERGIDPTKLVICENSSRTLCLEGTRFRKCGNMSPPTSNLLRIQKNPPSNGLQIEGQMSFMTNFPFVSNKSNPLINELSVQHRTMIRLLLHPIL